MLQHGVIQRSRRAPAARCRSPAGSAGPGPPRPGHRPPAGRTAAPLPRSGPAACSPGSAAAGGPPPCAAPAGSAPAAHAPPLSAGQPALGQIACRRHAGCHTLDDCWHAAAQAARNLAQSRLDLCKPCQHSSPAAAQIPWRTWAAYSSMRPDSMWRSVARLSRRARASMSSACALELGSCSARSSASMVASCSLAASPSMPASVLTSAATGAWLRRLSHCQLAVSHAAGQGPAEAALRPMLVACTAPSRSRQRRARRVWAGCRRACCRRAQVDAAGAGARAGCGKHLCAAACPGQARPAQRPHRLHLAASCGCHAHVPTHRLLGPGRPCRGRSTSPCDSMRA